MARKSIEELSPAEFVEAVRQLMAQGGSNRSVAKELDVTPGSIAGIRWRNNIPSTRPALLPPRERRKLPKPAAQPARRALAASEATQCMHRGKDRMRCAYERAAGSTYCTKHR